MTSKIGATTTGYSIVDHHGFTFNYGKYKVVVWLSEGIVELRSRQKMHIPKSDNFKRVSFPITEVREIVRLVERSWELKKEAVEKSRKLRTKLGIKIGF